MKILSIETSGKICGVSILDNTKILKEFTLGNGLTHSETLMPIIKNILEDLNYKINDIDLIVCDKGPGSFTGIRIGVATAKAFSDALNIKAIGISSLEALCYNIEKPSVICSIIDAKNDNCYWCVCENIEENYLIRRNFDISNIEDILKELKSLNLGYCLTFVGNGAINYKNKILEYLPESKFCKKDISSSKLALCGLSHYETDENIDELLPMYLRKSQAEIVMEEKQNAKNK